MWMLLRCGGLAKKPQATKRRLWIVRVWAVAAKKAHWRRGTGSGGCVDLGKNVSAQTKGSNYPVMPK
jgi:hypothetical protein